jgi:hypothetical protein
MRYMLVAACLIMADRGVTRFSITSPASAESFPAEFRLATQVAEHLDPPASRPSLDVVARQSPGVEACKTHLASY